MAFVGAKIYITLFICSITNQVCQESGCLIDFMSRASRHPYPMVIVSGGSRHSARGPHRVANPDTWLGGNLMCFPISHMYFFVGGGQSLSQTGWRAMVRFAPLDPPLMIVWKSLVSALNGSHIEGWRIAEHESSVSRLH